MLQAYEVRVNDEFVLRGNTAILKCIVPSFVADFIHVVAWISDNYTISSEETKNINYGSKKRVGVCSPILSSFLCYIISIF